MGPFEFTNSDRVFKCERGPSAATPDIQWWWVKVSNDNNRYAAFHSKPGDSRGNLEPRIIAYYEQLLADRARPPAPRVGWGGRRPAAATAAVAAPATVEVPAPETAEATTD
jgi:hypothetical protein